MDEKTYENVAMRREAGAVKRWHIVPTVGVGETVGHHTYNAVSLLLYLNPGASRALIIYMLEHDVTERWTGDIPASAKGMFHEICLGVQIAEKTLTDEMDLMNTDGLGPTECHWARAIDALDAVLFCHEQLAMGNQNFENALVSLEEWFGREECIPDAILEFLRDYEWKRYPDWLWSGHYGDNEQ
ncbi:hypothetical protein LCGC14_0599570 [marine sediment metagenome]|uniref:HD domain-containing protein n=1 Tax=marine sediment metagenome TaxID=412755 RepID=A0A0F9RUT6_9ZZZZ